MPGTALGAEGCEGELRRHGARAHGVPHLEGSSHVNAMIPQNYML